MSSWKNKLRPASFRGIKFFVDSSTYSSGRRGPDHEFPDRDDPFSDDTGRKQRKYDLQVYLLGADYLSAKNDLITACEVKGPGELIHPYYGKVRVQCREFSVEEKGGEGGFVRFTISFREAGLLVYPKVGADAGLQVASSGAALSAASQADFAKKFSAASQPQFAIDSATSKVSDVSDKLSSATSGVSGSAAGIANLAFAVRQLKAGAKDIIAQPSKLAQQIDNAFSLLSGAASPNDVFKACQSLFPFGSSDAPISKTTSTRAAQAANLAALNEVVQTIAVSHASIAATDMSFASVEDATSVRDQLGDQLDKLMESTGSDEVYSALQAHRAQVVRAIPPSDQTLAHVSAYTPRATVPSLVLAFDLYGSVDDEQDIIDRNDIRNPSFVKGGKVLEVLDRG